MFPTGGFLKMLTSVSTQKQAIMREDIGIYWEFRIPAADSMGLSCPKFRRVKLHQANQANQMNDSRSITVQTTSNNPTFHRTYQDRDSGFIHEKPGISLCSCSTTAAPHHHGIAGADGRWLDRATISALLSAMS